MSNPNIENPPPAAPSDFIRDIVANHVAENKYPRIHTRFPPEPNGYLHIGHAKSICLNFGIAHEFGGICNLRMDDTNPTKEDVEYVDSIQEDVNWLISAWADKNLGLKPKGKTPEAVTSNGKPDFYLPRSTCCSGAVPSASPSARRDATRPSRTILRLRLLRPDLRIRRHAHQKGHGLRCDLTPEETDDYRRNAKESPYRNRSVAENLDLFTRMKAGEFPDGKRSLRAKIDMAAPNVWMRDPAALPHPPRRTSSHRRQMVHLPDVRFRPLPERLHRRHHAQHLHARIRGAPPAVRLDFGEPRPATSPAPSIRIRAPQPHLHRHEQTQAAPARERKTRHRLGRPAHAHHQRHPAARSHRRGAARLLPTTSASPNTTASPMWPCSNTPSAKT